ncbi:MAG: hypothetical protein ACOYL6_08160 [Bacteriovoracaceae bacterium]
MKTKAKQTLIGLILVSVGLAITVKNEVKHEFNRKITFNNTQNTLPEGVYTELNHLENDLSRLVNQIEKSQSSDNAAGEVKASAESAETQVLAGYESTQEAVLNLINWLKEKRLLFRNEIANSLPSFPQAYRLQDSEMLENWKGMFAKAVKMKSLQALKLNISEANKNEIQKRLTVISNEAQKIHWQNQAVVKMSPVNNNSQKNSNSSVLILAKQMQKSLGQIDDEMVRWGQAVNETVKNAKNVSANQTDVTKNPEFWFSLTLALMGLGLIGQAIYSSWGSNPDNFETVSDEAILMAEAEIALANRSAEVKPTLTVNESVIFDRMNQPVFFLTSKYDILWSNQSAQKLSMNSESLSQLLRAAYKDDSGKRISSIGLRDYFVDVEYLEQKMDDGSKIFCLILTGAQESEKGIIMEENDFSSLMKNSFDNKSFDFNFFVLNELEKMAYIFKLSGTEFLYGQAGSKETLQCLADIKKCESSTKLYISALHQLVKDDFEAKAVMINAQASGPRMILSAFIPAFNVDGKLQQMKKLAYQAFLEEMVKVEKHMMAYGARIVLRQQAGSQTELGGLLIEFSFENKNALEEMLKKAHINA